MYSGCLLLVLFCKFSLKRFVEVLFFDLRNIDGVILNRAAVHPVINIFTILILTTISKQYYADVESYLILCHQRSQISRIVFHIPRF